MKTLFLTTLAVVITFAFSPAVRADQDSQRIYSALNTFGRSVESVGPETTRKSVGGLVCDQERMQGAGVVYVDYDCDLQSKNRDDKAIYQALSVPAVRDRHARAGEIVDVKEVANLKCTSTSAASGGAAAFACDLD